MAKKMVECKNCNAMIPAKSKKCPMCGVKNKKPIYRRGWFILLILILVLWGGLSVRKSIREKIIWEEIELSHMLPQPESNAGKVNSDSQTYMSLYIYKTAKEAYRDYVDKCVDMGFDIESNHAERSYSAFNRKGYKLSLSYYESSEEMHIILDAPEKMGALSWPESEIAMMLPKPTASAGKIIKESPNCLYAYLGNISFEEYANYVTQCEEIGFNENYEKGEKYYRADNADGYHLSVNYQGGSVVYLEIEKIENDLGDTEVEEESVPETEEKTEQEEEPEQTEPEETIVLINGMRPEFKEAMDAYEDFYKEYCDFFKEYEENPTNLTLIAKYGELMVKAAEMDEAFGKWDEEEMNNAELKYYLDVNNRVMKMLVDVAG